MLIYIIILGHHEWTISGLWPLKKFSKPLEYCNKRLPFDESSLSSISSQLIKAWNPDFEKENPISLIKEEWLKHGTCSTKVENINDPLKYFSKGT